MLDTHKFALYFGEQKTSYIKDSLHGQNQQEIMQLPGYKEFCDENKCEKLVILEQVHGNSGYAVQHEQDARIKPYSAQGDYIVTTQKQTAIAVETADCVPLVLVDAVTPCSAMVHAGWRGSVSGVVRNAISDMLKMGSNLENIQAYFGPAARSCCYAVSDDFVSNFASEDTVHCIKRGSKLYFDNTLFIISQLEKLGIASHNIITDYAVCTVCSLEYCSFRRQRDLGLRQMTIVALK